MRNVRILIAVIAVFLLVAPVALAQVKPPQPAPVPNVAGRSLGDAQKALVSAGFNAVVTHENVTDPGKNNIVLKQQIAPGTTLAKGSSVPVVVGRYTAPAQQPVPNVVGMPLDRAQATLSQAKLNAAVTMQPVDQPQRNNIVLAQNVPAGKPLSPGSMVPIVVGRYTAPALVSVPNATGMKTDTARQMLEKQGWKVTVQDRPVSDPRQAGMVIQQTPLPGTKAGNKDHPVTLHVGKALAQTRVPTVTGMPLDAAQKQLAAAKLNAVVSFEAVAEPAKNNFVLRQQAAPGTALAPGAQVPLTVGKYTAPAALSVPSVTGKPLAEAQKILAANKLNAVVNQEKVTDRSKDSIVLKQQVAPGTALAPGSRVPLVVGRYEAPAKVPNVVGRNWGEAKTSLTQAKLTPNFVFRSTSLKQKNNIVLEQSVRAGTEVAPGTKVDVFVGRYRTAAEIAREIQNRPQSNINQPIPADNVK